MIDFFPQTTTEPAHNGLPTIGSPANPLRVDILNRLELLFRCMASFHPTLLFFGCELGFPPGLLCPPGNYLLIAFEQRFAGALRNVGLDVRFAWSRDQERCGQNHSYSFVGLVGVPPGGQIPACLGLAESIWRGHILGASAGPGLARPFAGDGILLHSGEPDFPEALAHAFHAASRLARSESKRLAHDANSFGSSRI